jgi:hypothetical protein
MNEGRPGGRSDAIPVFEQMRDVGELRAPINSGVSISQRLILHIMLGVEPYGATPWSAKLRFISRRTEERAD